ncbi:MAG: DUF1460 domain-containing protein [Gemmatimonadota bacterium]|nr:DUF1460 domain-containing protein [Acidobacteriota bacterium]MDE2984945.1 DUF1460 domain-containing protein [Gemmatimonadota bacterium]
MKARPVGWAVVAGVLLALVCYAAYDNLWERGRADSSQPAEDSALQRPAAGTARDWEIAREHFAWAVAQPPATFPRFGDLLARLGERFAGTPYQPHTLELDGPERLVINLEALDCVTFVENVLVLARLAWSARAGAAHMADGIDVAAAPAASAAGKSASRPSGPLDDPDRFRAAYRDELTRIRYRGGELDGYASRLHYFSEWIADNEAAGLVDAISRELGGVADPSPIDFMSTHPDAYRQLADRDVLAEIADMEARLAEVDRYQIPAGAIDAAAAGIRDGDIIAATSTVPGLDIAHTGIALWRQGTLRLMHAPLVGSHVRISEESLAERIARIGGQDGIMVARPLPPGT